MYPRYNVYPMNYSRNMYNNGDRFIGGGVLAPLLIGGIAGYAIGNNNNNGFGSPNFYPPFNYYNANFFYPRPQNQCCGFYR